MEAFLIDEIKKIHSLSIRWIFPKEEKSLALALLQSRHLFLIESRDWAETYLSLFENWPHPHLQYFLVFYFRICIYFFSKILLGLSYLKLSSFALSIAISPQLQAARWHIINAKIPILVMKSLSRCSCNLNPLPWKITAKIFPVFFLHQYMYWKEKQLKPIKWY